MFYYDDLPGTGDYNPPENKYGEPCDQCGGKWHDAGDELVESPCGHIICETCDNNNKERDFDNYHETPGPAQQSPEHKTDFGYVK